MVCNDACMSRGHVGELAQLAERVLCMHEVAGSIPAFSILLMFKRTFLTFLQRERILC